MVKFEELAGCLEDTLDVSLDDVMEETPLETLPEWDSMNALRVLQEIERRHQVRLTISEFIKVTTVGELYSLVQAGVA